MGWGVSMPFAGRVVDGWRVVVRREELLVVVLGAWMLVVVVVLGAPLLVDVLVVPVLVDVLVVPVLVDVLAVPPLELAELECAKTAPTQNECPAGSKSHFSGIDGFLTERN